MKKNMANKQALRLGVLAAFPILLSAVLLALPVGSWAASPAAALYEASIPVLDQSDSERRKTLRTGLESVIVRVSGQTDFRDNPVIKEALGNADAYLLQFTYSALSESEKTALRIETETKNRLAARSAGANKSSPALPPTIRINLTFSPEAIKALLRKAQLPIWPANRPSVLVWVVSDAGAGKQQLLASDPAQDFLLKEAKRRGLPLMLPMNDLKDQLALGVERLWNLDQAAIAEAAQRYGEGSVLVGKAMQLPGGEWQGSWLYLLKGQSWSLESNSEDFETFLSQGINEAIRVQVQRYGAVSASGAGTVPLVVTGVGNLKDYANTLQFLKNLDPVKSVRVTAVKGNILYAAVELDGDSQILRELIALGSLLVPDETVATEPQAEGSLYYRLARP